MKFNEWAASVPTEIRNDLLWKIEAYRLGLFVPDLGWRDVTRLMQYGRTHETAAQLTRHWVRFTQTSQKHIRAAQRGIERVSTNTHLDPPGKRSIDISTRDTFEERSRRTGWIY